jgi:hypothetical protein
MLSLHKTPWRRTGEWRYSSTYSFLDTKWGKWLASRPGRLEPRYPLNTKLRGPQSRSGRCGEDKNPALPGIEPRSPEVAKSLDWLKETTLLNNPVNERNESILNSWINSDDVTTAAL